MNDQDQKMIARLVREGMLISKVWEERFSQYSYDEVYWAAYGQGARSATGTQRMISSRLNQLEDADEKARRHLIEEIAELVWRQYESIRSNAQKLDQIRKALER